MIDHLLGRPSPSWKRAQVFLVILFWAWRIAHGDPSGPRLFWLRRFNRVLSRFTPWQLVVSTLTGVYALRNIDKILGLPAPDPLANLYSPSYYRATWIATGLDAGFATAMTIRPNWLKDICSIIFSMYYIIYANEADEKLRRYRAVPTVEMLRSTWEKTTNPYIRALIHMPKCSIARKILLPRPDGSSYQRPITAWLFFAPPAEEIIQCTEIILDFPGGGFVAMNPAHHEDRLRAWAVRTRRPVVAIDYGKAPEYPYPFAAEEAYDAYMALTATHGRLLGLAGNAPLDVIMHGDSAGATIAVNAMLRILERGGPRPRALILTYAALDFNFRSWMSPGDLRLLRAQQSVGDLGAPAERKDHYTVRESPLSMVSDHRRPPRRRRSLREALRSPLSAEVSPERSTRLKTVKSEASHLYRTSNVPGNENAATDGQDSKMNGGIEPSHLSQSILERQQMVHSRPTIAKQEGTRERLGTRITMTSRTGYFQDRIITPSMMRAMALLYIGPSLAPQFDTDYHVSPILTPPHLLAQFPPLLLTCGERDPFVDDTVLLAGRVRDAKRARLRELDTLLAGGSARFGEGLRMSQGTPTAIAPEELRALKRERERLASEGDDDWVRMVIFEDWSHGYLQMMDLLPEARVIVEDMADWIDEVFRSARQTPVPPTASSPRSPPLRPMGSATTRGKEATPKPIWQDQPVTGALSETEGTDAEADADSPIVFTPKRQRTPPRGAYGEVRRKRGSRTTSSGSGSIDISRLLPPGMLSAEDSALDLREMVADDQAVAMSRDGRRKSSSATSTTIVGRDDLSRSGTPGAGTLTPVGGKVGLSEMELMKRRRLLDAHMFE